MVTDKKVGAWFAMKKIITLYTCVVNIYNVRLLVEPVYNPCGVDRAKRGGASAHVSKYNTIYR